MTSKFVNVQYVNQVKDKLTGQIVEESCGEPTIVDTEMTLRELKKLCPNFFDTAREENYEVYRGCIIITCIDTAAHVPTKRLSAYYFGVNDKDAHCFSSGGLKTTDPDEAKALIDRILHEGKYYYGMQAPEDWYTSYDDEDSDEEE